MNEDLRAVFEARKSALKIKFLTVLDDRVASLSENIEAFRKSSDPGALERCRFDLHKTAGVAGSFGYEELGQTARRITTRLAAEDATEGYPTMFADIAAFLRMADEILGRGQPDIRPGH